MFASKNIRDIALSEMKRVQENHVIVFKAWVILPDHIHWVIKPNKADYSKVVSSFKRGFNLEYKRGGYQKLREKNWHPRFWEHTVRDEDDYSRCVDYVNFNPVKHGYVTTPNEWEHSSYQNYVRKGLYGTDKRYDKGLMVDGAEYD